MKFLNYSSEDIVWQEVPGETSLGYTITGCPVGCKGCHSVDTWPVGSGLVLEPDYFKKRLQDYQGLISCVLFLGGEWQPNALYDLLVIAKEQGLKTCLYTGYESVSIKLQSKLDYLKTGPWIAERGGLDNPNTNQVFTELRTGRVMNHLFWPQPEIDKNAKPVAKSSRDALTTTSEKEWFGTVNL